MKTNKKYDYNSTANQEIKSKFVAREVYCCFSYEMEAIFEASMNATNNKYPLPAFEDIENMYLPTCPECGTISNEWPEVYEDDEKRYKCKYCEKTFDEIPETEPQEIYEWWIVSNWLYKKLKDKGKPVLEWGNNCFWGRTCTGQAILLDSVISEICSDLGILEGQKSDWSKAK